MSRKRRAGADPATPRWLLVPAALAALLVLVPVLGLALRVPWDRFGALITSASALTALRLSVQSAAIATAVVLVTGLPLALLLARARGRWAAVVRAAVLIPLVLPPVVGGLALLYTFGRRGLVGERLDLWWGIDVSFSTTAVVLAQVFTALPFLVLTVEAAVRGIDRRYEQIAATLGAGPTTVLRRVTLPMIGPAVVTGTVLAFARALGEFGATITFAGSLQGRTRTLPLEIYLQRVDDPDAAVALSMLLVALAVVIVATVHGRGGPTPWRRRGRVGRQEQTG